MHNNIEGRKIDKRQKKRQGNRIIFLWTIVKTRNKVSIIIRAMYTKNNG